MEMSNRNAADIFIWIFIALILILTLFPFYWVIKTALTVPKEVYTNPSAFFPAKPTGANYLRVLGFMDAATAVQAGGSGQTLKFLLFLRNSVFVSTLITAGQVFFSAMAAYAFARLRFPFRNQLFGIFVSALMIPSIVLLIPNFVFIRSLNWLETYQGIAAPAFFMTPFAVFFLRQFFLGINKELEEAALVEGAGRIRIFFQIILPLSATAVTTLAIITFIFHWNDYLWPLLVGKKEDVRVLTVALGIFRQQTPQGSPDWSGLMAGTSLAIVPTLLLFALLGKRIINSIGFTGFR